MSGGASSHAAPRRDLQGPPAKRTKQTPALTLGPGGGAHASNRRGIQLCDAFKEGTCTATGPGNKCPSDNTKVHQCSNCLKAGHSRVNCPNPPAAYSAGGRKSKGKGKGKKQGRK